MLRRSLAAGLAVAWALAAVFAVPPPASAAPALVASVVSRTVEAEFPTGITFSLDYESERTVDEAYLVYALADEDYSTEVSAELAPDGATTATAEIDMSVAFVPPGVDVTYRWRLVAGEAETATDPETVVWLDDRFEWESETAEDLEVYTYGDGDALRDEVLESAGDALGTLSEELDVEVDDPIRIWVYGSGEDFRGTQAANSQEWVAGSAYPSLGLILAVIPGDRPSEIGRIIPHEISHQLLAIAADNPYNSPATWLDEGLAIRQQTNGTDHMTRLVARAKRDGELLPLDSLDFSFPYEPSDASLAYAQSFGAVSYLVDTYGEEAVGAIVDAYAAGSTHDDAVRAGTGLDVAQLDAEWQATIDDGLASTVDRRAVAQFLLYGLPGLGVIAFLVARRFRPPRESEELLP